MTLSFKKNSRDMRSRISPKALSRPQGREPGQGGPTRRVLRGTKNNSGWWGRKGRRKPRTPRGLLGDRSEEQGGNVLALYLADQGDALKLRDHLHEINDPATGLAMLLTGSL